MPVNKFFSLKIKMLLALLPLTVLFALFCFAVIKGGEKLSLTRSITMRSESLGESLALMSIDALSNPNDSAKSVLLKRNIARLAEQRNVVALEVLDSSGKVKAGSIISELGTIKNDENSRRALGLTMAQSNLEIFNNMLCAVSSVPIRSADTSLGVVRVYISAEELNSAFSSLKIQLAGLVCVLISGALGFTAFISYFYGNPLLNLAEAADKMAQGKLEVRADENRLDEIGLTASRLNRLAEYIQNIISSSKLESENKRLRVQSLRNFIDGVLSGESEGQAQVEDIDELGQLTMSVNELVRHMRTLSATEEALQKRVHDSEHLDVGSCPTIGDIPVKGQTSSQISPDLSASSAPQYYKNRILPESETVIAMAAPVPPPKPISSPSAPANTSQDKQNNSFISFQNEYSLSQGGELNTSQLEYVNKLSRMGAGKTALIATGGAEDSYPFLRQVLENEGFNIIYASTVNELLEIASYARFDLVMMEFNDLDGGNQQALKKLRSLPGGKDISAVLLEASERSQTSAISGAIQIFIPNSDEELIIMIREALAEIVLTGGRNPFIS
ncbi:MAG: HAMP domain-containing protein [Candidatus Bruticola sp.]